MLKIKLYQVIYHCSNQPKDETYETFVVASNKEHASNLVGCNVSMYHTVTIINIKEISMNKPKILCSVDTYDLDF